MIRQFAFAKAAKFCTVVLLELKKGEHGCRAVVYSILLMSFKSTNKSKVLQMAEVLRIQKLMSCHGFCNVFV